MWLKDLCQPCPRFFPNVVNLPGENHETGSLLSSGKACCLFCCHRTLAKIQQVF